MKHNPVHQGVNNHSKLSPLHWRGQSAKTRANLTSAPGMTMTVLELLVHTFLKDWMREPPMYVRTVSATRRHSKKNSAEWSGKNGPLRKCQREQELCGVSGGGVGQFLHTIQCTMTTHPHLIFDHCNKTKIGCQKLLILQIEFHQNPSKNFIILSKRTRK
jgi:hypothetical protein